MKVRFALLTTMLAVFSASLPAATLTFDAFLNGPSEIPTNSSPGIGYGVFTFDTTAHTMQVVASFAGLLGNTTVAHVHLATTPGGTGGVATPTPTFTGFPPGVKAGYYTRLFDMTLASSYNPAFLNNAVNMGDTGLAEQTLLAGVLAGRAYLNIHSEVFGGGEIRGFLAPVPEPATFGLAAVAVGALALRRRRLV